MSKKILFLCHDLTTRLHLSATWSAAGVDMLKPTSEDLPDCIIVDLGRRDSLDEIQRLRALHPHTAIIACFATYNDDAVGAAREPAQRFRRAQLSKRRVARLLDLEI
jgi:DNA-binding NarL/FixJ family response regulator